MSGPSHDVVLVRILTPVLVDGKERRPGLVEVPALVAARLIETPRARLERPDIDGGAVRAAVEAETRRNTAAERHAPRGFA